MASTRTLTAAPTAVERYFEVALYLMLLSGFTTLAQTRQLDPFTVLLVIAALVARGYLLVRHIAFVLAERWTQYLTVFFTFFYLLDVFVVSARFVAATVHLVLALMVVRLFSAHRDRDHIFLAILAFLQLLAASVLTVDASFLVTFACFMLAAVATFILLEMKRSSAAATKQACEPDQAEVQPRMGVSVALVILSLVFFILVIASGIFFLLPRMSGGYLNAYAVGGELASGFSDRVRLGQIGEIQRSNSVMMHIQIDGDRSGAYNLKWRGVALTVFDGKTWWSPRKQVVIPRWPDGRYPLPAEGEATRIARLRHIIHYRVLLEAMGTNVFFLAAKPEAIEGNYRMITVDQEGAVYDLDHEHAPSLYEADSDISEPSAPELRLTSGSFSGSYEKQYLQLPALDPRIRQLAEQITAGMNNNYDKAQAIEHYLSTHYGYALRLGRTVPQDPLVYFLFEHRQGHCEYFASSMAVMLRNLGIPARVVNGFRTGEFNDITAQYVVRARNAHSWVEAYFPPYGWISFDPTPATGLDGRRGMNRMMLYVDAFSSFWREWVINYDSSHQQMVGQQAARNGQQMVWELQGWARRRYSALLEMRDRIRKPIFQSRKSWTPAGVRGALLILMLVGVRKFVLLLRWHGLTKHPEKSPQRAATVWYQRMTRAMARRGWPKSLLQTPSEFVSSITKREVREAVAQFTAHYQKARFGDSVEDARQLPTLYQKILGSDHPRH